jgi:hypothetical protein
MRKTQAILVIYMHGHDETPLVSAAYKVQTE